MLTPSLAFQARGLASRGAWSGLCLLLGKERMTVDADLELVTLLGEALLRTGRPREARDLLGDCLPNFRVFGGIPTMRRATNLSGAAHFELGELEPAQAAFERAMELAHLDGDDLLAAQASNNLAMIANIHGQHEEALGLYRVALPAYQRLGNAVGLATSLHNMAITYRDIARYDDAEDYERRAAECAREAGDDRLVAIAIMGRAEVQLLRGDAPMAEATAMHAAACLGRVPDPARRADALRLAGIARARYADAAGAQALMDEAVTAARACGAALIEAESLRARGELAMARGDRAAARADGDAALILFSGLGATREEAATARWLETLGH